MFNRLRIFAPPEFPVLSLEVQAHLPVVEAQEQSQFRLLVRHFLERFFNNDMVSADGETKARLLQVVYAIALPGLVVALFLFPMYHAPLERPFWSQVSDHYFYVLYSFVAVGAVSIFAWDLLFPDLLDLFVLSSAPHCRRETVSVQDCRCRTFSRSVPAWQQCARAPFSIPCYPTRQAWHAICWPMCLQSWPAARLLQR